MILERKASEIRSFAFRHARFVRSPTGTFTHLHDVFCAPQIFASGLLICSTGHQPDLVTHQQDQRPIPWIQIDITFVIRGWTKRFRFLFLAGLGCLHWLHEALPQINPSIMKVWAVSDLHTDYKDNMSWAEQLCSSQECSQDTIIVAGDVSDNLDTLSRTLELLTSAYGHVFFIPGNHDLWCRHAEREQYDSLGKLELVRAISDKWGVHMSPACVGGVWVVPLLSWYHASWDREPDLPGAIPIEKIMMDFHACTWTSVPGLSARDESVAAHMDRLNDPAFEKALEAIEAEERSTGRRPPVVSFSHFLPYQELLPEKRMLHYPNLAKAAGSDYLAARVSRLRPAAHVFGHTHFSWDAVGPHSVRFVQWPLGYPAEQRRRARPASEWRPMLVWDGDRDALSSPRACYWSSHYAVAGRRPNILTPAPWVSA